MILTGEKRKEVNKKQEKRKKEKRKTIRIKKRKDKKSVIPFHFQSGQVFRYAGQLKSRKYGHLPEQADDFL